METQAVSAYTVAKAALREPLRPKVRCVFRRDSGSLTFDVPPSETTRWRAVARVLRGPLDALGCALLPAFCTLCGSPLPHLSSVPICDVCWSEFPLQTGPACARCGDSLPTLAPASLQSLTGLCRACRMAPPPFVRAVSYGPYQDPMRAAIHALKYDRLHPAARRLGRMLALAIAKLAGEAPSEMLVVPVPLLMRSMPCDPPIRNGGSNSPPAPSCACAPPRVRPDSAPACVASMYAEPSRFPIRPTS